MRDQQRSRANLRSPSRSAWVIDRLLKNQNPLEKRNTLRSPSPLLVVGRRPENRAAVLRSEIHGHGSHGCSDRWCSVRAFDDSTARRSAAATSRGPRPGGSRAGWRLRQSHHLAPVLSSTGDDSRPHHANLERKIPARLFRRFPRPVEARITPDSRFSSMGSAFTETA